MNKEYSDITLICKDCGKEFIWKAGEQRFYAEKELQTPVRCKDCRQARKQMFEEKSQEQTNDEFEKMLEDWKSRTIKF